MMRGIAGNSARRGIGLLAAALTAIAVSSTAEAAVLISSGATTNIACVSGICTPSKKTAVLNVTQLQSLLAAGNVTVTTAGAKSFDIVVSANLGWASAYSLTLDAYQSITIDKAVSVNGTSALTLTTNDGGMSGLLSFGAKGHVAFLSTANSLTINGAAYTLIADTTTLANDIAATPSGNFALAADYNAAGNPASVTTTFNGSFQGLGNTISKLNLSGEGFSQNQALFDAVGSSGTVEYIKLTGIKFSGNAYQAGGVVGNNQGLVIGDSTTGVIKSTSTTLSAGGLVGNNDGGSVVNSYSTVNISVTTKGSGDVSAVGGLVGYSTGSISGCYATGDVKTLKNDDVGGLVGSNVGFSGAGNVTNSYASGSVSAGAKADVGGLIGLSASFEGNGGIVTASYSTGAVTAGSSSDIGGLIGEDHQNSTTANSDNYWDTSSSGITNPSQGAGNVSNDPGVTGLSTAQLQSGLPAGFNSTIWGENSSINGGLPYLLALPPPA